MARTRYIKPGFFQNDRLCELGPWHRLLFAGLWTIADRSGRLEDRPKRIKGELFPYDDVDVNALLSDLSVGPDSFVIRYHIDGIRYLALRKWTLHQKPHPNEAESVIPHHDNAQNTEQLDSLAPKSEQRTTKVVTTTHQGRNEQDLYENSNKNSNGDGDSNGDGGRRSERAVSVLDVSAHDLMELWNTIAVSLPQCRALSEKRKRTAQARLRERPNLGEWREVIRRIEASEFCRGVKPGAGNWVATFDWLLAPDTALKVLEGKYDNRASQEKPATKPQPAYASDWFAHCREVHGGACLGQQAHAIKCQLDAAKAARVSA